jgi:hypothetical protein
MADAAPKVTIEKLDLQIDVADDERQVFARLFDERFEAAVRRWWRHEKERKARERLIHAERALGDRSQLPEDA